MGPYRRLGCGDAVASVLLALTTLVTTVDGLQRVLEATTGELYQVRVKEGVEVTVALWMPWVLHPGGGARRSGRRARAG